MTDCEKCTISKPDPVPYLTHEKDMARMERANFRVWIAFLITLGLLVVSVVGWAYFVSQYTYEETTIEQDTDGGGYNYVVGGDYNGASEGND